MAHARRPRRAAGTHAGTRNRILQVRLMAGGASRGARGGKPIITTARGDIEYAVEGQGVPHLWIHGSPGGYENGLAGRRAYPDAYPNVMTITASRPGFLRTPLSSGRAFRGTGRFVCRAIG